MPDMAVVYVAIGSNVAPMVNVPSAVELLATHARLTGLSSFYRTAAIAQREQDDYVNGVARLETALPPLQFKHGVLRAIEAQLGRERGEDKDAPRTIDLDILLYDSLNMDDAELTLPAPELFERPFLVQCLLEVAPEIVVPGMVRPPAPQGIPLPELTLALHQRWLP